MVTNKAGYGWVKHFFILLTKIACFIQYLLAVLIKENYMINLCSRQDAVERGASSCCSRMWQCRPTVFDLTPGQTVGLIATVAGVALVALLAFVGGISCSAIVGGVLAGLVGFCVAALSFTVLFFSVRVLVHVVKELRCDNALQSAVSDSQAIEGPESRELSSLNVVD